MTPCVSDRVSVPVRRVYVDALTQHLGEGVSSFLSFVLGFPWELASGWGVIFIPGTRDACEVRLCGLCAFVRPRVPCVSCVSRLPPVSFYRYRTGTGAMKPLTKEHSKFLEFVV